MRNEKISEEDILKEIDVFLENRKSQKESNHRLAGCGDALDMMIAGSKMMPKEISSKDIKG